MRCGAEFAQRQEPQSIQGCQFHAHVVQCRDNRLRSGPVRVRVLPWAPFQSLRSSVDRVADYESAGRRCESCRRHHFNAPVAQCIEHRASNAEAGGESPPGSATSSWNVNRTSVPGLVANEIVPPLCGMRSMSSAFRHFSMPTNAKSSRDRSFKSVLAGASPAVGANLNLTNRASVL